MRGRRLLLGSATLVIASWGLFALSYATADPGEYGSGFDASLVLAVATTCLAALFTAAAWRGTERARVAVALSGVAVPAILWLAIAARPG